jgi:hypothetical protein
MQNLKSRIDTLEKSSLTSDGITTIVVKFLSTDNRGAEIQTLKDSQSDQQWQRQPGETEQALIDRATNEVQRDGAFCKMLMQVD